METQKENLYFNTGAQRIIFHLGILLQSPMSDSIGPSYVHVLFCTFLLNFETFFFVERLVGFTSCGSTFITYIERISCNKPRILYLYFTCDHKESDTSN